MYYTLDYGVPLGNDISLGLHYGLQTFDNDVFGDEDAYSDYNVSLTMPFSGVNLSLMYSDTTLSEADCFGSEDCSAVVVFGIAKAF